MKKMSLLVCLFALVLATITFLPTKSSGSAPDEQIFGVISVGGKFRTSSNAGTFSWSPEDHLFKIMAGQKYDLFLGARGNDGSQGDVVVKSGSMDVNGDVYANTFSKNSDLRFKTNINSIPSALNKVLKLRGVSYNWNSEAFPQKHFSSGQEVGFIAQEVEKVLPEVVSKDESGYYSVDYTSVVPVLVEAVKSQQGIIDSQKSQINQQKAELDLVKNRMQALEQKIEKLTR